MERTIAGGTEEVIAPLSLESTMSLDKLSETCWLSFGWPLRLYFCWVFLFMVFIKLLRIYTLHDLIDTILP